jgi:hypothetical protein
MWSSVWSFAAAVSGSKPLVRETVFKQLWSDHLQTFGYDHLEKSWCHFFAKNVLKTHHLTAKITTSDKPDSSTYIPT